MRAGGGEQPGHNNPPPPTLTEVVTTLRTLGKTELPKQLSRWLDELDETGRWALLKLVTGAMRIGVSARLAKTAAAALGDKDPHDIELMWPGLAPPYLDLFAWLEGRADKPVNLDPAPFRPVMLAHAIEDADFANLDAADFVAEWKWDGIRVQAVSGRDERGHMQARLYSRTGEDITKSFPDLLPSLHLPGAIDGELLVLRDGRVQTFNVLQQRLNRKVVSPKLIKEYPIHLRAYDLLGDGEDDLRDAAVRRTPRSGSRPSSPSSTIPAIDLSPTIAFDSWDALDSGPRRSRRRRRRRRRRGGRGRDAEAPRRALSAGPPQGPMVEVEARSAPHRRRADVCAARPRQALVVLFRLHVRGLDLRRRRRQLVPVGKAYFGFTDEELLQIDRFVRRNTTEKFGPVRHVVHEPDQGLVLEVAFEGLARSPRHKSGVAMRFPRINRLRWDKPPREADRLETLERMLKAEATQARLPAGIRPLTPARRVPHVMPTRL